MFYLIFFKKKRNCALLEDPPGMLFLIFAGTADLTKTEKETRQVHTKITNKKFCF